MRILLVDWLGRGGIAQCTESWAIELGRLGADVRTVTRAGRELAERVAHPVGARVGKNRILAHRAVVSRAVQEITTWRPHVVVAQNYVIPHLERTLARSAKRAGALLVWVVHDHTHHSVAAGTRIGLRANLLLCDAVVAHSRFVADAVSGLLGGREVSVIPHPIHVGLVNGAVGRPLVPQNGLVALAFGTMRRGYKGVAVVAALAARGVPGWSFAVLGLGAPRIPGVSVVDRYIESPDLVASVMEASAIVLPYDRASQSGVVVLAQALGVVPVASAVGGIPEQIPDGTGVLIAPGADVAVWRDALIGLSDDVVRREIGRRARVHVEAEHAEFVHGIKELLT